MRKVVCWIVAIIIGCTFILLALSCKDKPLKAEWPQPLWTWDSAFPARKDTDKTPGYSWCLYCERTWDKVKGHNTYIKEESDGIGIGIGPLCEQCYVQLPQDKRIFYYKKLYYGWPERARSFTWEEVESVLNKENKE